MAKLFSPPSSGGGGVALSDSTPAGPGTPSAGVSALASRDDHVHAVPSAAAVGAAPTSHTHTPGDITGTAVVTTDARLSDTRTPTDGTVTDAKVAAGAAIAESKLALASDAAAGTASRRTIGAGALQAASGADVDALTANRLELANSCETMERRYVTSSSVTALASGRLVLMFVVATKTRTVGSFKLPVGGTGSSGITLARMGLFTAPNPDGTGMTCVAASASNTSLGNTTFATATASFATNAVGGQAMPTSYQLTRGAVYAIGIIFVGTTMPVLYGSNNLPSIAFDSPRVVGSLSSQTDLVLNPGALSNNPAASIYAALT